MKRVFYALLVSAVLLGILLFSKAKEATEPDPPSPVTPTKHSSVPQPLPAIQNERPSPIRPVQQTGEEDGVEAVPVPGTVHFRVQDGLAIAQGDLILGTPDDPTTGSGSYVMPEVQYWRTAEIPYAIDQALPDPERVETALKHIESKTGFQFVPFNGQPDAVLFRPTKKDCLSALGRQGGVQPIKLDAQCGWHEITHEVLHAMGFIHEQSRTDRDRYVEVLWPNIAPEFRDQFELLPDDFLGPAKDTAFDYHSIMLYEANVFSKSGQPTLRSKTPDPITPSRNGLSPSDIARIRAFYSLKS